MRAKTLLLGASIPMLGGCAPCATQSGDTERYTDGTVSPSGLSYQSTLMGEDFLPFPPGKTYELVHGLGVAPTSVHGYVSFIPQLTEDGDPFDRFAPNNLSEAAGNQMVIERWDEQVVRIRNDTCAEFYVRVVAFVDELASTGAAGAAGAPSGP